MSFIFFLYHKDSMILFSWKKMLVQFAVLQQFNDFIFCVLSSEVVLLEMGIYLYPFYFTGIET